MADAYFSNVSLLLPLDGSAAATTFRDYSNTHHVVTTAGGVIAKPVGKYNGSAAYFDGTGDYLTLDGSAEFAFGTGDFCIETWVWLTSVSASYGIIDLRPLATTGYYPFLHVNTSGNIIFWVNEVAVISAAHGISAGTWAHVAVTKSSGSTKVFVNGVQKGSTYADSNTYLVGASRPAIGSSGYSLSLLNLNGYLADLRITKGVARYAADFTAPTSPFRHALDPNVVLRLTGDDLFNYSQNTGAITVSGTAAVSATQFKYGTKSLYFDGTASYVRFGNTTDALGTSDFTIEFWVMPSTPANNFPVVIESGTSPSASWGVQIGRTAVGQKVQFWVDNVSTSAAMMTGATTLSTSAWSHVAITRSGTAFNIWVNGVSDATATSSANMRATADSITVGTDSSASAQTYFKGYIDDLAITKRCKYTATFTPPVAQLPTETTADEYLSSVSLQLKMDEADTSTTFTDTSNTPKTVSVFGNAQISTAQSRFGGASAYFDGTGDYLSLAAHADFVFGTGAFTIEAWIYPAANSDVIVANTASGQDTSWQLMVSATGNVQFLTFITVLATGATTITLNAWSHVAISFDGVTYRVYLNGVMDGSGTTIKNMSTSAAVRIGTNNSLSSYYSGYIDDLRITKGVARYV